MTRLIAISKARSTLPQIIGSVHRHLSRFLITVNGKPKAAILSLEELESLEETAEVLSIAQAKASIAKGFNQAKNRRGTPLSRLD